jgi:hypothetical protein
MALCILLKIMVLTEVSEYACLQDAVVATETLAYCRISDPCKVEKYVEHAGFRE